MHWPKVSEKKKQELEQLKMSYKTSPLRKKSPTSNNLSVKDIQSRNGLRGRTASENH